MRMLMKLQIPTEPGNEAIRSGSLPRTLGSVIQSLFMGMNARITMIPAMNAEDMQVGIAKE